MPSFFCFFCFFFFPNHFRDRRQIIFVTLNRFCTLNNPPPPSPVLNGQYQTGYQSKLNEKIHACFHIISSFEGTSDKKIQLPVFHFLLFSIRIYINRYHFLQLFRTSFNTILKKIFVTKFPLTAKIN